MFEAEPVYRAGPGDDLLSAGLGLEGLRNPVLPKGISARSAAIHKDFRDLVDLSPGGRFEDFLPGGAAALRVDGWEYAALLRLGGTEHPISVRVLIPDHFNEARPLLVVAPSSGSRGVTGAIGDIGAWALPRGYALVLTDKGTGGVQILADDTCYGPDLEPTYGSHALTTFRLKPTAALREFRRRHSAAIALKHAHSMQNVEADWPRAVLAATRFGLDVLNKLGIPHGHERVRVIAAGVSNGGGAVLRAAEVDASGMIDAVVAVEPNITPRECHGSKVAFDGADPVACGRPLVDFATAMNLLLPAALLSPELADAPFFSVTAMAQARQAAWARGLADQGLLDGSDTTAWAADALRRISALGFDPGAQALFPMMAVMHIWPAVSHTFVSALGRFPVEADPIGAHTAFATADPLGQVLEELATPTAEQKRLYAALSGGLSPGGGAFTIHANGDIHPSLEDALKLRQLAQGKGAEGKRVQRGCDDVLASARPRGHSTIILHGRCDSLISVQHTSRAYFAACLASGGDTRHWRYYEHENGQHFETLLGIPGMTEHYDPLLPCVFNALDLMQQHLFDGTALPPNQVVRGTDSDTAGNNGFARQRGGAGSIRAEPGPDRITVNSLVLSIPR